MSSRHAWILAAFAGLALVGCGGGGRSDDGGAPSPSPSQPPSPSPSVGSVDVTIDTAPIARTLQPGVAFETTVEGTLVGRGIYQSSVFVKISDSGGAFTVPTAPVDASSLSFRLPITMPASAPAAERVGTLTVIACSDATCSKPYPGQAGTLGYRLHVSAIADWETMGRNAAHRSYVPIVIDSFYIDDVWEWTFPKDAAAREGRLSRPATGAGAVFVSASNIASDGSQYGHVLVALDEATGKPKWTNPVAGHALAPAASRGLVYQPALASSAMLTVVDAEQGKTRYTHGTASASATTLAPSFFDGNAYFVGGDNGDELRAINATTGALQWSRPRLGTQTTTPAVDAANVYYHSGSSLEVHSRSSGALVASIADPASDGAPYPGPVAPVLGSRGNVIANSWNEATRVGKLTSFDIATRRVQWSTFQSYRPVLALADGVVYAYRRTAMPTIDAIDETTGVVLWSWSPPAIEAQLYPAGNIVATDNLLFVSTTSDTQGWTWAIDRNTQQIMWRYPASGTVAISANGTMYLIADPNVSAWADRLIAFRFR